MEFNKDLSSLNSFGLAITAARYHEFQSPDSVISFVNSKNFNPDDTLVLGGGSNILFTKDYAGLILKNEIKGFSLIKKDSKHIWIKVGAGENWHQTVIRCIENGWAGIENLSLIPGNVGAAPIQNIGAYGVELKDVFDELEWLNYQDRKITSMTAEDCGFGYRDSVFKNELKGKGVILTVTMKLSLEPSLNTSYGAIAQVLEEKGVKSPDIRDVSNAVIEIRRSKLPDPALIGNGGSFFKNPVISPEMYTRLLRSFPTLPTYQQENGMKVPAAWLIDQAGWKGYRRGNIGVHKNQALVLVNYGGGLGSDIKQLALDVQLSVQDKFGIHLETEINII